MPIKLPRFLGGDTFTFGKTDVDKDITESLKRDLEMEQKRFTLPNDPMQGFLGSLFGNQEFMGSFMSLLTGLMSPQGSNPGFDPNNPMFRGRVDQGFGNDNFSFRKGGRTRRYPFGGYTPTLYNNSRPIRSFDTNFAKDSGSGGPFGSSSGFNSGNIHPTNVPPNFSGKQDAPVNTGIPNTTLTELFRAGDTTRRQYLPFFAKYGGSPEIMKYGEPGTAYPDKYEDIDFVPVQTEPKEKAILPDYAIVDTKSTKLHKDMKPDKITDILPSESYITSDKVIIKRNKIKDIKFGFLPGYYDENNYDNSPLQEVKFEDLYKDNEDELSTYTMTKRVQEMFPSTDRRDDPFADITIRENRQNRAIWLETIKELNEEKRKKNMSEYIPALSYGGRIKRAKYQGGGPLDAIGLGLAGIGQIFNVISNIGSKKRARKDQGRRQQLFQDVMGQQQTNLDLGTMIGLGSILGQNPYVEAPDRSQQLNILRNRSNKIPQNVIDSYVSRNRGAANLATNAIFRNSSNTGRAMSRIAAVTGPIENRIAQGLQNFALQDVQLRNKNLTDEANIVGISATERANASNQTRTNRNRQLGSAGTLGVNNFNNRNALLSNYVNNLLVSEGLATNQINSSNNAIGQGITNLGATLMGYNFNNPPQTPTQPVSGNTGTNQLYYMDPAGNLQPFNPSQAVNSGGNTIF